VHLFDASAYIDQHVDVLQFLPDAAKKSFLPVPLFTLTGCSSRLVQTAGRIRSEATAHGRSFVQRTRAVLTGKARALQAGTKERAISGGAPQDPQEKKVRRDKSCHAFLGVAGNGRSPVRPKLSFAPANRR
jgi:hypothetical protein